jgi:hypothetical protein
VRNTSCHPKFIHDKYPAEDLKENTASLEKKIEMKWISPRKEMEKTHIPRILPIS